MIISAKIEPYWPRLLHRETLFALINWSRLLLPLDRNEGRREILRGISSLNKPHTLRCLFTGERSALDQAQLTSRLQTRPKPAVSLLKSLAEFFVINFLWWYYRDANINYKKVLAGREEKKRTKSKNFTAKPEEGWLFFPRVRQAKVRRWQGKVSVCLVG